MSNKKRVGIITLSFAYNYGAMLQAYALKSFINEKGGDAAIIPYFPSFFRKQYSISPLSKGISFKRRAFNLVYYPLRHGQISKFELFKREMLYSSDGSDEFEGEFQLTLNCRSYDVIVYGSDQIWNPRIVNNDPSYFGRSIHKTKVSYAASIGDAKIIDFDTRELGELLKDFTRVSVREPYARDMIMQNLGIEVEVVCDPVFLLNKDSWAAIEQDINKTDQYVLVYLLREDMDLINRAIEYASAHDCELCVIHPMMIKTIKSVKTIGDVGPREFLYLIHHAECVVTNSFHALAFCLLFKKKTIHTPNKESPERTLNILSRLELGNLKAPFFVDFETVDETGIESLIETSKKFIERYIVDCE